MLQGSCLLLALGFGGCFPELKGFHRAFLARGRRWRGSGGTARPPPPPPRGNRLLAQLQHPERGFMRQLSQFKSRLLPKGAGRRPPPTPLRPPEASPVIGVEDLATLTAGQDPAESLGLVIFFNFFFFGRVSWSHSPAAAPPPDSHSGEEAGTYLPPPAAASPPTEL